MNKEAIIETLNYLKEKRKQLEIQAAQEKEDNFQLLNEMADLDLTILKLEELLKQ